MYFNPTKICNVSEANFIIDMAWTEKNSRITLSSIAKDLKLATSTVSFCLSGKASQYGIKSETEKLVCDYAAQVGYVANSAARQLRGNCAAPIGLLFDPRINSGAVPSEALSQAIQRITSAKREVRVVASDLFSGLIQLRELNCREAIIFQTVTEAPGSKEALQKTLNAYLTAAAGIKLFCLNYGFHKYETPLLPNIVRLGIHRREINLLLVKYLNELTGKPVMLSSWAGVSEDDDLPVSMLNVPSDMRPYELGHFWAQEYLQQRKHLPIGAIMPGDDRVSAGLISELLAHKVKIPQDVRIISFDNLDFGAYLPVPLTSWGVPIKKHIQMVLDCLLDHAEIPERLISVPEFVWRQSCGFTASEQQNFEKNVNKLYNKLNT